MMDTNYVDIPEGPPPPPGAWERRRKRERAKAAEETATLERRILQRLDWARDGLSTAELAQRLELPGGGVGLRGYLRRLGATERDGRYYHPDHLTGATPTPQEGPMASLSDRIVAHLRANPSQSARQIAAATATGYSTVDYVLRILMTKDGSVIRRDTGLTGRNEPRVVYSLREATDPVPTPVPEPEAVPAAEAVAVAEPAEARTVADVDPDATAPDPAQPQASSAVRAASALREMGKAVAGLGDAFQDPAAADPAPVERSDATGTPECDPQPTAAGEVTMLTGDLAVFAPGIIGEYRYRDENGGSMIWAHNRGHMCVLSPEGYPRAPETAYEHVVVLAIAAGQKAKKARLAAHEAELDRDALERAAVLLRNRPV